MLPSARLRGIEPRPSASSPPTLDLRAASAWWGPLELRQRLSGHYSDCDALSPEPRSRARVFSMHRPPGYASRRSGALPLSYSRKCTKPQQARSLLGFESLSPRPKADGQCDEMCMNSTLFTSGDLVNKLEQTKRKSRPTPKGGRLGEPPSGVEPDGAEYKTATPPRGEGNGGESTTRT